MNPAMLSLTPVPSHDRGRCRPAAERARRGVRVGWRPEQRRRWCTPSSMAGAEHL